MSSTEFDYSEFDYRLPEELIAQQPLPDRAGARMLVLHREKLQWEDRMFREFPSFLRPGDCLVLNNSKVFPSRLYGRINMGQRSGQRPGVSVAIEVFLLRPVSEDGKTWHALVRPGRKVQVGEHIRFDAVEAEIISRGEYGERTLRFQTDKDVFGLLDSIGHVPLPPYIKRPDTSDDRERYQTVFAEKPGSVAAPTAGLHFTPGILDACCAAGAEVAPITLHVGLGTFQPVRGETLHSEQFQVPAGSALKIQSAIRSAGRLVCAGTTSVRAVESMLLGRCGETDLFIRPGFPFRGAGAMLTNFHLPQSSLLMLVCAFAGREFVLSAYRHAVESSYRFYSYGDCMLIV